MNARNRHGLVLGSLLFVAICCSFLWADPFHMPISWSPDGKLFLFATHSASGSELLVNNFNRRAIRPVVASTEPIVFAAFAPDAARLAYLCVPKDPAGPAELHVINTNGTDNRVVARGKNNRGLAEEASFSWMPNSTDLVFGAWQPLDAPGGPGLYRVDMHGRNLQRLNPDGEQAFHPRCSPDGSTVLYLSRSGGPVALTRLDLASGDRIVLVEDILPGTAPVGVVNAPAWSPDGKLFAFVEQRPNTDLTSVWVAGLGRIPREVSPPFEAAAAPSWSGDSTSVAFFCGGRHSPASLWTAKAGSLMVDLLLDDSLYNVMPSWSPNGDWIATRSFWLEDGHSPEGVLVRLVDRKGAVQTMQEEDSLAVAAMHVRAKPGPDTAEALERLLKRGERHAGAAQRWVLLADYHTTKGDFEEAAKCWANAAAATVDDKALKLRRLRAEADAWAQAGYDHHAIRAYERIASDLPEADSQQASERIEALRQILRTKLELRRSASPDLMAQLAGQYDRIGCRSQAINWRSQLIEQYPHYRGLAAVVTDLVADCEAVPLGSISWRALGMATTALRQGGQPMPPRLALFAGEADIRLGRTASALENLVDVVEAGPAAQPIAQRTAMAFVDLGDLFRKNADYATAVECYTSALKLWQPGVGRRAHSGMAQAYRGQGRHQEAGRAYQSALGMSRPSQAKQIVWLITQAIEAAPDAQSRAPYLQALAKAYELAGRAKKAAELRALAAQGK